MIGLALLGIAVFAALRLGRLESGHPGMQWVYFVITAIGGFYAWLFASMAILNPPIDTYSMGALTLFWLFSLFVAWAWLLILGEVTRNT